jgi:hypothetical protein
VEAQPLAHPADHTMCCYSEFFPNDQRESVLWPWEGAPLAPAGGRVK